MAESSARRLAPPTAPGLIARERLWRAAIAIIDRGHRIGLMLSQEDAEELADAALQAAGDPRRTPCASS